MATKAAVVIPVYKAELNELEKISLTQCSRVLGSYPLIFVAPEGKNFSYLAQSDMILHCPPQFFQSVQTYNHLMMSPDFYDVFKDFDYILIYQLDAFVFYDALEDFCSLGYDYIGAPWPRMYIKNVPENISHVGNGGFSLRNVKAHVELLTNQPDLINYWHARYFPEDAFFSYCGKRDDCDFRVAPINVAYQFAAEFNIDRVVKKNSGKLPFGCHAWFRQYQDFHINILPQMGYDSHLVQSLITKRSDGGFKDWLIRTAFQRLERRLQRGQSIMRYLPRRDFASVRGVRHPAAMMILTRLLLENPMLADKIFLYDNDEQDLLLNDLTLQKLPHLLIDFETDLISAVEGRGFAYGKRVVSFWREYLTRCEELFHNLGK